MMTNHDLMPAFEVYQPADLPEAYHLLERFGKDAWKLAGGHDSLSWFKTRVKRPKAVIDLTGIPGLAGIRTIDGGLEIGALTTLAAIEADPLVNTGYRLLADAAGRVASPQIRTTGTIGGNVAQHARCWYYRDGLNCWRAGGGSCFAQHHDSINREHAVFDIGDCAAVNPSDIAPALVALEARMVIDNAKGRREVEAERFFIGVDTSVTSFNILEPGDILTAIRLPAAWAGAHVYFEKVADRQSWDFPLVNIAAARIVCGAVSAIPRRFPQAEELARGRPANEETGRLAGQLAVRDASALAHNAYKLPLVSNLVTRAIRDAKS